MSVVCELNIYLLDLMAFQHTDALETREDDI